MNKSRISEKHTSSILNLNSVYVKFAKKRKIRFMIGSSENRFIRFLFDDQQECAEIKTAGSDHFATFETVFGKVTYVFCKHGLGFKIGPGSTQKTFEWE